MNPIQKVKTIKVLITRDLRNSNVSDLVYTDLQLLIDLAHNQGKYVDFIFKSLLEIKDYIIQEKDVGNSHVTQIVKLLNLFV